MSTFKLPEGFGELIETDEIEETIVEEVPKDKELKLEEVTETEEEISTGNVLKNKGIISKENITGTFTEETGRGILKIINKIQGKEVEEDASIIESLTGAGISGTIKIPKGLITFGTLLTDIFRDQDIPVDETLTSKFNEAFDQSILGKIENASEEVARETAAGKITEAITQLYGGGKIAQKVAIPVITKGSQYVRKLVDGIKTGRYVRTTNNVNAARALKKANDLNKITNTDKFIGIAVGGGIGGGFIVSNVEDIERIVTGKQIF